MEIKRKLSYSETNLREQLLDGIQIKLQCAFNLNFTLEQAIYAKVWGNKQKVTKIIKMIEGSIIHDNFKYFTQLSIHFHMSTTRVSRLLHRVDRVLRKFILDKYTSKCRCLGIEMLIDVDDYINLIGKKDTSFMYLQRISNDIDYDMFIVNYMRNTLSESFSIPLSLFGLISKPHSDSLRPNDLSNKLQEGL
jgi:hypothetical protein